MSIPILLLRGFERGGLSCCGDPDSEKFSFDSRYDNNMAFGESSEGKKKEEAAHIKRRGKKG